MAALGIQDVSALPWSGLDAGINFDFGTWLAPGSRVVYCHHSAGRANDIEPIRGRTFSTLNSALAQCRSGAGDAVCVLEGHAENISAADQMSNLVAGTKIIGMGRGTQRGAFTWTAAASTFLLDVAGVQLINLILNLDPGTGSVNVTAPITISAAGCGIHGCQIRFGTDANSLTTTGITTTASADDFDFIGNHCWGATAAEVTTFMQLIGVDRMRMIGNYIAGATSATTVGIIRYATTASLNIISAYNTFINRKALSTAAVTGLAGVSGVSYGDHFAYLDTSSLTAWLTSTGIMTYHRPTVTNTAGETGTEVVGTVSA